MSRKVELTLGVLHMKSGSQIQFAAEQLEYNHTLTDITKVKYTFRKYQHIDVVQFVAWDQVEAITYSNTVEVVLDQ